MKVKWWCTVYLLNCNNWLHNYWTVCPLGWLTKASPLSSPAVGSSYTLLTLTSNSLESLLSRSIGHICNCLVRDKGKKYSKINPKNLLFLILSLILIRKNKPKAIISNQLSSSTNNNPKHIPKSINLMLIKLFNRIKTFNINIRVISNI